MTVQVTLLPATVPPAFHSDNPSRMREYNNDKPEGARYSYTIKGSGSLVIFRENMSDGKNGILEVFGPAAWEEVSGDLYEKPA